jgi:TRAP-type C4-dicarboxylate transport system permease small subunit
LKIISMLARGAARLSAAVAGLSLLLMMSQTVIDVVLRAGFNNPIEGNLEVVSLYHMVAVVFLPLALVELKREHISVDLFVAAFSARVQIGFYVFAQIVALMFLSLLFYRTLLDALHSTRINQVVMGSALLVIWPAKWMLPVGFGAMMLAVASNAASALANPDTFDARPEAPLAD